MAESDNRTVLGTVEEGVGGEMVSLPATEYDALVVAAAAPREATIRGFMIETVLAERDAARAEVARLKGLIYQHRERWLRRTAELGNDIDQTDPLHIDRDLWAAVPVPDPEGTPQ